MIKEKSKRKSKNNSSCPEPFRRILFHSEKQLQTKGDCDFEHFCAGSRIDVNRINVYLLQHYNLLCEVHSPLLTMERRGFDSGDGGVRVDCTEGKNCAVYCCCCRCVFTQMQTSIRIDSLSLVVLCLSRVAVCFLHFVYIKSKSLTDCVCFSLTASTSGCVYVCLTFHKSINLEPNVYTFNLHYFSFIFRSIILLFSLNTVWLDCFCLRVFIFSLLASTQIRLKRDFDLPGVKMQLQTFTATAAASLCIAKINRYEFAQCTHFRTCTNALTRYVVAVRVYYWEYILRPNYTIHNIIRFTRCSARPMHLHTHMLCRSPCLNCIQVYCTIAHATFTVWVNYCRWMSTTLFNSFKINFLSKPQMCRLTFSFIFIVASDHSK